MKITDINMISVEPKAYSLRINGNNYLAVHVPYTPTKPTYEVVLHSNTDMLVLKDVGCIFSSEIFKEKAIELKIKFNIN